MSRARAPLWPGARNALDVGRLRLEGGGTTREGRLFRSGAVGAVAPEARARITALGITRIVDLRNEDERNVVPTTGLDVPVLERPIEDLGRPGFLDRNRAILAHPDYFAVVLAEFPGMLARAVDAVLDAGPGVLVQCSAGRDRTGLIVTLVLRSAGVELDDVVAEYERGIRGFASWQADHPGVSREPTPTAEELTDSVTERRGALTGWLRSLDVASVLEEIGVGSSATERARALLT